MGYTGEPGLRNREILFSDNDTLSWYVSLLHKNNSRSAGESQADGYNELKSVS